MLQAYPRCEECGRRILGHEDGGAGAREALVTAPQQRGRKVAFTQRAGYFHENCLQTRLRLHRRRAKRLLTVVSAAAGSTAVVTWWLGGPPAFGLLVAGLGWYAAYLEANDVRAVG